MNEPTIEHIDGQWLVSHAGMRRYFVDEWQAQWFFSYCLRTKNCGLEPAHAPDAPHCRSAATDSVHRQERAIEF